MKRFEIWAEGYVASGDRGGASLLGIVNAESFKAACDTLASCNHEFASYYSPKQMTYWGCNLYDNETDARRSFG